MGKGRPWEGGGREGLSHHHYLRRERRRVIMKTRSKSTGMGTGSPRALDRAEIAFRMTHTLEK